MSKCLDPFRFLLISLAGWMKQQWPISTRPIKPRSHDRSHAGISHERLARRRYVPCPRLWRLLCDPRSFRGTRRVKFRSSGVGCNHCWAVGRVIEPHAVKLSRNQTPPAHVTKE